jgi:hypothetical protein
LEQGESRRSVLAAINPSCATREIESVSERINLMQRRRSIFLRRAPRLGNRLAGDQSALRRIAGITRH